MKFAVHQTVFSLLIVYYVRRVVVDMHHYVIDFLVQLTFIRMYGMLCWERLV